MKVLVALSGGVDSSVAAARVKDMGFDAIGVHLALSRHRDLFRTSRGCCTVEDAMDARRVASLLNIPFYVWDFSKEFKRDVVDDFIKEYESGRTPNPCLRCNEKIKFKALLDRAIAMGFDAVATGHWARIVEKDGRKELHRAKNKSKDQSYVLGVLTYAQLDRCIFPLGEDETKEDIRLEAKKRGFVTAEKKDSYDICFIQDGKTAQFLKERIKTHAGPIVDHQNRQVGTHDGAVLYTIGQRRGLNIGAQVSLDTPKYITAIDPATNTITVGSKEKLAVGVLCGQRFVFLSKVEKRLFKRGVPARVQVRAHGTAVDCVFFVRKAEILLRKDQTKKGYECAVELNAPLFGVATGQTAVVYGVDDSKVIASFTIDKTIHQDVRSKEKTSNSPKADGYKS